MSINVYSCDEMNTQIEPSCDDEDSTYTMQQTRNTTQVKAKVARGNYKFRLGSLFV